MRNMQENRFQKALEVATKGGLGLLLYDASTDNSVVVLPLEKYEKLLNGGTVENSGQKEDIRSLTELEMLDKINRDIALWKNEQESNVFVSESSPVEDADYRLMLDDIRRYQRDSKWRIPEERKEIKRF